MFMFELIFLLNLVKNTAGAPEKSRTQYKRINNTEHITSTGITQIKGAQ